VSEPAQGDQVHPHIAQALQTLGSGLDQLHQKHAELHKQVMDAVTAERHTELIRDPKTGKATGSVSRIKQLEKASS
jgi:hypothetical protein